MLNQTETENGWLHLFFYFKTSLVVAFEQEKQQRDQMHTAFKYFQVQVVGNRMWCGLATTIG